MAVDLDDIPLLKAALAKMPNVPRLDIPGIIRALWNCLPSMAAWLEAFGNIADGTSMFLAEMWTDRLTPLLRDMVAGVRGVPGMVRGFFISFHNAWWPVALSVWGAFCGSLGSLAASLWGRARAVPPLFLAVLQAFGGVLEGLPSLVLLVLRRALVRLSGKLHSLLGLLVLGAGYVGQGFAFLGGLAWRGVGHVGSLFLSLGHVAAYLAACLAQLLSFAGVSVGVRVGLLREAFVALGLWIAHGLSYVWRAVVFVGVVTGRGLGHLGKVFYALGGETLEGLFSSAGILMDSRLGLLLEALATLGGLGVATLAGGLSFVGDTMGGFLGLFGLVGVGAARVGSFGAGMFWGIYGIVAAIEWTFWPVVALVASIIALIMSGAWWRSSRVSEEGGDSDALRVFCRWCCY